MDIRWRTFYEEGPRLSWAAAALLVAATLGAYHNSLHGPFIFDDPVSILENKTVHNLFDLPKVLSPSQGGLTTSGRPVVNLSVAVNYAIGTTDPTGYHVMNLAIHVLAGLALMAVVRRTLLLPQLAPRWGPMATPLATAAALLWMVHPLQTEAVTYIIQRAESIVTLFYLLTIYCTIRLAACRRSGGWSVAAVACCAVGMASKEVMISAPLVVLLYDRAFLGGSFRQAFRLRWRLYVGLAATWLLLAYLVLATGQRGGTAGFGIGITWWQYARTQFGVVVHYLQLAFWPSPLVLAYGWPVATSVGQILPAALAIAALLATTAWALVRRPMWGVPAALFFLALAPTSSVVPIRDLAFEHRMYLPLAGIIVLLVVGGYGLLERVLRRRGGSVGPGCRTAMAALVLALAAVLAWQTSLRNADYRSTLSIWMDTATKAPANPRPQNAIAAVYAEMAKPLLERSQQLFQAARAEESEGNGPSAKDYRRQAAAALAEATALAKTTERYNCRALELASDKTGARLNLGSAYLLRALICLAAGDEATREQKAEYCSFVAKALEQYEAIPDHPDAREKISRWRTNLEAMKRELRS